jgi:hypothetical protein
MRSLGLSRPGKIRLGANLHTARTGLAAMFLNQEESTVSEHTSKTIGTFLHVLLSGLIVQWLIDPASALSAKDLTAALGSMAAGLRSDAKAPKPKRKRGPPKKR